MNMQQLMAQAQRMQKDVLAKKEQINSMTFVGKSDWVEVSFKGDRVPFKVDIKNDEAYNKENSDILNDMILIAIKDGLKQIDDETNNKLGSYGNMGGLI